jgi:hypothetical protein
MERHQREEWITDKREIFIQEDGMQTISLFPTREERQTVPQLIQRVEGLGTF